MDNYREAIHENEINASDYINVLLRRRNIFLIVFSFVLIFAALYTFLMKPVYQATASFRVESRKQNSGDIGIVQNLLFNTEDPVLTEMQIIKSRSDAEKTVKKAHLDWVISRKSRGLDVKVIDFSTDRKPGHGNVVYKVELAGSQSYRVLDGNGNLVGQGKSGEFMHGKGVDILIHVLSGKPGDSFCLTLNDFNSAVAAFMGALEVQEAGGKGSNIMAVSYANTDPRLAKDALNTLLEVYVSQNIRFGNAEALKAAGFIDNQLDKTREKLDKAEKKLSDYRRSTHLVDLDAQGSQLVTSIAAVNTQRDADDLLRQRIQFAIAALKNAIRSGKTYSPEVGLDAPVLAGMARQLVDLETQRRGLLTLYTVNYPPVQVINEQIGELQKKMLDSYETALNNTSGTEAGLTRLMNAYDGKIGRLPGTERQLAGLMRDETVGANTYTFLLQQDEQERIEAASTLGNINIIDSAETGETPIRPKKKLYLLIGLVFALMLGVTAAFFAEYIDDTIKDADSATRVFGAPFLAAIPYINGATAGIGRRGGGLSAGGRTLVAYNAPKSVATETFRGLRTAIHFVAAGRKRQHIFTVTSALRGEGKSTISANLAVITAQTGIRTVIVDCDLRRPSLHHFFECDCAQGVSDVLVEDIDMDTVIRKTKIDGLDFIAAGTLPPNPAELIGSEAMSRLIGRLSEQYDRVIIDGPPILPVSDAPFLAAAANMVLLVISTGKVPAKTARRVKEVLDNARVSVTGVVMNQDSNGGKRYGYRYYGIYEETDEEEKSWWRRVLKKIKS